MSNMFDDEDDRDTLGQAMLHNHRESERTRSALQCPFVSDMAHHAEEEKDTLGVAMLVAPRKSSHPHSSTSSAWWKNQFVPMK